MNNQNILQEAQAIMAERQQAYGSPVPHWNAVAAVWTQFLDQAGLLKENAGLDPSHAANMMALLKVMRLANGYHRDSVVDGINYLLIGHMAEQTEMRWAEKAARNRLMRWFTLTPKAKKPKKTK